MVKIRLPAAEIFIFLSKTLAKLANFNCISYLYLYLMYFNVLHLADMNLSVCEIPLMRNPPKVIVFGDNHASKRPFFPYFSQNSCKEGDFSTGSDPISYSTSNEHNLKRFWGLKLSENCKGKAFWCLPFPLQTVFLNFLQNLSEKEKNFTLFHLCN